MASNASSIEERLNAFETRLDDIESRLDVLSKCAAQSDKNRELIEDLQQELDYITAQELRARTNGGRSE